MTGLVGGRKASVLVLVLTFALTLGVLSTAAESAGFLLLAGAAALVLLAVIVGVWSISGLARALMLGAALTVSMIALRAGSEVTFADVLLGAAAVPILIMASRRRRDDGRPVVLRWHLPVLVLVALVIAGGLGGSFSATDQILSLAELGRFAASTMVVVALFWLWAPSRPTLEQLCWALVAGATVNGVLGLIMEKFGGRAMGLSGHPNHLALACALSMGTALGLLFTTSRVSRRALLTLCLAALGVGVVASGSRAGLLAAMVSIGVFLALTRRWKLIGLGVVAAGLVGASIYLNVFSMGELNAVNRLRGDRSSFEADRARLEMAQETVDAIRGNPITGSGFESAKSAHSIYLQLWASAGLLGVAFAAGLVILTIRLLLEARRHDDYLSMGLGASYAGYLVLGAVSNILWDRYVWVHLSVLLTLVATGSTAKAPAEPVRVPARAAGRLDAGRRPV